MLFGFLTKFSEEELALAERTGYKGLEVHFSSWPAQVHASTKRQDEAAKKALDLMAVYGVKISAVSRYMPNALAEPKAAVKKEYRQAIRMAKLLGAPAVATLAGRIPDKAPEDSLPVFKKVFGEVAKMAADAGVKIAIENWPGMIGWPRVGVNIAYSPRLWAMMFDAVPHPSLGLEFDPSHLVWQGIDYIRALHEFGDRIHHVHLKDTEILHHQQQQRGIFDGGWWRYRIPGWGQVNWQAFLSALNDVGYTGGLAIEHEDPIFSGDRREEGLVLGQRFLSQLLVKPD